MFPWPFARRRRETELEKEVRAHLIMAARDRIESGESVDDAERLARRELGNAAMAMEVTREMWGWVRLDRFLKDSRYGLRALRRNPGYAATAMICLAVGIGANTAAFSVADALLLRPLPVEDPQHVIAIASSSPDTPSEGISYRELLDIRERTRSFEGVVGFRLTRMGVATRVDAVPMMRMGFYVTKGFFQELGVRPAAGRVFTDGETEIPGRGPVMVLSNEFWKSEFGSSAGTVGSTIRLNGIPFTVIGIAPAAFTPIANMRAAFYLPLTMMERLSPGRGQMALERRDLRDLNVRARLRRGVRLEEARSEVATLAHGLEQQYPETNRLRAMTVRTELGQRMQMSPPLAMVAAVLVALAGMVLLIACANVACLLLARSRVRAREIAIRLSIGASRPRLFQQLLTESLLLSLCGGAAGVVLAIGAIRYLSSIQIPTDTPIVVAVQLDARVLVFALASSLASVLLSGVAPAWRSLGADPATALKPGARESGGRGRMLGRNALVACQVALSLVLVVAAATLLDAFRKMLFVDPGIRIDRVMMVELDPGLVQYNTEQAVQFYQNLVDRARQLPGIRSVTMARTIPFRPHFSEEAIIPEGYDFPKDQKSVVVTSNTVDEDYFRTMGVPLVSGRGFTRADTATSRRVAVVNQEFARRYWRGNAVGKRFRVGVNGPYVEVVGVARNGKYLSLAETPLPYFFLPYAQNARTGMTLLAETEGDPAAMTAPILNLVRSLDANQPVFNVRPMRYYFDFGVLGLSLVVMQMVWAMGFGGLLIAVIGLYGLVSYSASRRTREIGIRIAVGADRGRVLSLILKQGLTLTLAGVVCGLALSIPLFRVLSAALAGLGEFTPLTLVGASAAILLVALAACYIPARRASRIDPTYALRFE